MWSIHSSPGMTQHRQLHDAISYENVFAHLKEKETDKKIPRTEKGRDTFKYVSGRTHRGCSEEYIPRGENTCTALC